MAPRASSRTDAEDAYDYIVVGAGSAGCVLANRLSADGRTRVLLLEAGGSDRRFWIRLPIGYGKTYYQTAVNWMYMTEPVPGLAGKPSYWPRGKVLGGSSSINAMVWIRGNAADYDGWRDAGNPGWSWQDVLPYFKRSETNAAGADAWRGGEGPVFVSDVSASVHPLCQDFFQAGRQAGLPFNADFNGASQEGVGPYQICMKDGWRMSAARAYLRPARGRSNLEVRTHAMVERILFDGRRTVGVCGTRHGRPWQARARAEVVLCAGAIETPALLQRSGVGPAGLLQSLQIPVICDSPAVGRNLQDHLGVDYLFRSRKPSLNNALSPWWGRVGAALQFAWARRGPLALSINQAGGFLRSTPAALRPDLQLYFSPLSYTRATPGTRPLMHPDPFPAFLLGVSNCRPHSRGEIRIRTPDAAHAPSIQPAYLSEPEDVRILLAGVRHLRRLASMPALSAVIERELRPGGDCLSEDALIRDIHENAWSVFHPACTCRMGPDPRTSVVDARLRVHGLERLRIADASIFPALVSGNTNAPVIMVGEKAADLILADAPQRRYSSAS
ncbi:MAG TPA: GMC family oxidoreductase N-terminal domain-containing protein [Castellaniella sp.]|nr:GMC family oxidoreductase N-terminal domain-containing protein [Castellaniella sp.]